MTNGNLTWNSVVHQYILLLIYMILFLEDETIQDSAFILRPKGNLISKYYIFAENLNYYLLYNNKISRYLLLKFFRPLDETTEYK